MLISFMFISQTYAYTGGETKLEGTGTQINIEPDKKLIGTLNLNNQLQIIINKEELNKTEVTLLSQSWITQEKTIQQDLNEYLDKTSDKYQELNKANTKTLNTTISLNDLEDTIVDSFVETADVNDEDNANVGNDFPWWQCTYYVARNKLVTWRGNAGEWYTNAIAAGVETSKTPKVWAIIVFKWKGYSKYWHVWIVESIEDNRIFISEMNAKWKWVISSRYVTKWDRRIIGYIYAEER